MTKKELSQLYYLNREIEQQKERLKELEAAATNATARITGMPFGTNVSDKIGNFAAEIADLKALIELNIQKCWYELNKLNRYINSIDDSLMRQLLTYRYINGLTWQQIAYNIGDHDEQYPRRLHNRFLKNNKFDEKDETKNL